MQALNACLQSFVVGPKFKGVKMLPPGTHMVSYNAASRTGDFAPTSSFFVHLAPSQVYVRRWSNEQELLFEVPADEVMLVLNCIHSATKAVKDGSTRYNICSSKVAHLIAHGYFVFSIKRTLFCSKGCCHVLIHVGAT